MKKILVLIVLASLSVSAFANGMGQVEDSKIDVLADTVPVACAACVKDGTVNGNPGPDLLDPAPENPNAPKGSKVKDK